MNLLAEYFADELRRARDEARMTQEQLATAIHKSKSTVAMVESCQRSPTADFAEDIDKVLDAGGRFTRMRAKLLRPEVNPAWFRPWMGYEQEAAEFRWYELTLVPGLLQTEAYAAALLGNEEQVAARMERQAVLDRTTLTAIVDESVLNRRIGTAAVMAEQLARLTSDSRAVVHVLPAGAETHAGTMGSFIVAVVDGTEVGYVETPARGFVLTDPGVVSKLRECWEAMATEALPRNLSREAIMKAVERWKAETG